jgi:hypothetical protein
MKKVREYLDIASFVLYDGENVPIEKLQFWLTGVKYFGGTHLLVKGHEFVGEFNGVELQPVVFRGECSPKGDNMKLHTKDQYDAALKLIDRLADAIEAYEEEHFPLPGPTKEDIERFNKEQRGQLPNGKTK